MRKNEDKIKNKLRKQIAEQEKLKIDYKRTKERLQYRIGFERLITILSTNFINLESNKIDDGINYALQKIGEFVDVDRSYVFIFYDNLQKMNNIYEWCAKGIEPQIQNNQDFLVKDFPWCEKKIKKFKTIYIPRVADLPAEAIEKKVFQAQKIQSLILVPMLYGKSLYGFLGFDSVRKEKTWTEDIITLLKIVGDMFVNALERKHTEDALKKSENKLNSILSSMTDLLFVLDKKGKFIFYRASDKELYISPEKFMGKKHSEVMPAHVNKLFINAFIKNKKGKSSEYEYWIKIGNKIEWYAVKLSPILSEGKFTGSVGVVRNITKRKQAEEDMKILATIDKLTGALNRAYGLLLFNKQLKISKRNKLKLSICYIDLNGLKKINDTYGHKEGDEVLKLTGRFINETIREIDIPCRLGGDEFLLVFPQCSKSQAKDIWKRIIMKITDFNAKHIKPYNLSLSSGFAEYDPMIKKSIDELITIADQNMYKNKYHKRDNKITSMD